MVALVTLVVAGAVGVARLGGGSGAAATAGAAAADHRGFYPAAEVESLETVRWRRDRSGSSYGQVASPAVAGDNVYVATDGTVAAFGLSKGELRWRAELAGVATVAADLGQLYALTPTTLHALAPEDGALRWSVRLPSAPGADVALDRQPLNVVAGTVTVRTTDGGVAAVAADGTMLWSLDPDGLAREGLDAIPQRAAFGPLRFGSTALLVTEAGDGVGSVRALDLGTGVTRWESVVAGPVASAPALVGRILVVGGEQLTAFDARDGDVLWRSRWDARGHVVAAGQRVALVGPQGSRLLDVRDGTQVAQGRGPGEVAAVAEPTLAVGPRSPAAVLPVHTAAGELRVLDASALVPVWWRRHVPVGRVPSVGAPGTVVTPTVDGHVLAFDADDGRLRWDRRLASAPACGLSGGGTLTYLVDDGRLHAFDAGEGTVAWSYSPDVPLVGAARSAGRRVAVVDTDGGVALLAAEDGTLSARADTGGDALGEAVLSGARAYAAGGNAAPPGGLDVSGWIRSVAVDSGASAWVAYALGPLAFPPTVADGRLVAITSQGFLQAFEAATGAPAWDGTDVEPPTGPVAAADGVAVVSDRRGLSAWSLRSGARRWEVDLPIPLLRSAAIAQGLVVARLDPSTVAAYDLASGEVRWRAPLGTAATSPVSIAAGRVYVGTRVGLAVLDLATGRQIARVSLAAPPVVAPIVASTGVTVCQADGSIVARGR